MPDLIDYIANLKNTCGNPIQVSAPRYANSRGFVNNAEGLPQTQHLDVGEIVYVFGEACLNRRGFFTISAFVSPIDELREECLPDEYTLEISSNGNKRTLNISQFLEALERAELVTSSGHTVYKWTISDPSLCP